MSQNQNMQQAIESIKQKVKTIKQKVERFNAKQQKLSQLSDMTIQAIKDAMESNYNQLMKLDTDGNELKKSNVVTNSTDNQIKKVIAAAHKELTELTELTKLTQLKKELKNNANKQILDHIEGKIKKMSALKDHLKNFTITESMNVNQLKKESDDIDKETTALTTLKNELQQYTSKESIQFSQDHLCKVKRFKDDFESQLKLLIQSKINSLNKEMSEELDKLIGSMKLAYECKEELKYYHSKELMNSNL